MFQDTGQGMSREQKERLFEPFNSSSGGTGLGMAIVYQLVRDHDGAVLVDSEIGNGTRISIKLPISGRVAVAPTKQDAPRADSPAPVAVAG
jgi:signal transduction histidine kinase